MSIDRLDFPLAKAEYLFKYSPGSGVGGDKQRFWRIVLGFDSPESIREAILSQVTIAQLKLTGVNSYGEKYQATVLIEGPSNVIWSVKTGWIVLMEENIARFVTAFPEKLGRQQ